VRYPPAGARGVALSVRGAGYGAARATDVGLIDAATTTLVQIENEDALAAVDAIASIDGVDVLVVGPNDLTHSLGIPGRFTDPLYLEAIAEVGRSARAAGKAAGVMLRSPDDVPMYHSLGYSFFALTSDTALLSGAARSALVTMRAGSQPAA
jgi:2-keto-3-deoxy-L-rhamnonate aldolase RhmA